MAFPVSSTVQFLVFAALISIGSCLNCTLCTVSAGRDECVQKSESVECTVGVVNDFHGDMGVSNSGLSLVDVDREGDNATFSCFSIETKMKNVPEGESNRIVVAGCTLERIDICNGWSSDIEVMHCAMCKTDTFCSGSGKNMIAGVALQISIIAILILGRVFY